MTHPLVTQQLMDKYGVAWFKFDEESGNVTDSKGTAVGTVYGATRVVGEDGGNALNFDGNDYVRFDSSVIPVGKKSIRFKIKVPSTSSEGLSILSCALYESGTVPYGFLFTIPSNNSKKLRIIHYHGSQSSDTGKIQIDSITDVVDGNWHDILFTWDGTTNNEGVKLYIDDLITPEIVSGYTFLDDVKYTSNLTIGRTNKSLIYNYLNGQLDNIEIYNEVITPDMLHVSKILISSNSMYKTFDGTKWIDVNENPTEEDFMIHGVDDFSTIPESAWIQLGQDFDIVEWTMRENSTPIELDFTHVPIRDLNGEINVYIQTNDLEKEYTAQIQGTPSPQLILSKGDISLENVANIDSFTVEGSGVKMIVSFDQGATWKASKDSVWQTIDLNDLEDVRTKSMDIATFNSIENNQWNTVRNFSQTVRFGYYLESDEDNTDTLISQIDLQGHWKKALESEAQYAYTSNTNLHIELFANGNYKINY